MAANAAGTARDQGFSFGGSLKPSAPVLLSLPKTVQGGLLPALLSSVSLQLPGESDGIPQGTCIWNGPLLGRVEAEPCFDVLHPANPGNPSAWAKSASLGLSAVGLESSLQSSTAWIYKESEVPVLDDFDCRRRYGAPQEAVQQGNVWTRWPRCRSNLLEPCSSRQLILVRQACIGRSV